MYVRGLKVKIVLYQLNNIRIGLGFVIVI